MLRTGAGALHVWVMNGQRAAEWAEMEHRHPHLHTRTLFTYLFIYLYIYFGVLPFRHACRIYSGPSWPSASAHQHMKASVR